MSLREELKDVAKDTARQGAEALVKEASKSFFTWVIERIKARIKARRARAGRP